MSINEMVNDRHNTIYTIAAHCHDCYCCVRACPVKAIRIVRGQAQVDDALCIKCGTCVRECPQKAKVIRSGLDEAKALIGSGRTVAISVAPSFAAAYPGWRTQRLPSALRMMGFRYITETAEGAAYVTDKAFQESMPGHICTACPAVVSYIEKYKPEYNSLMMPLVSPMIAHGRLLKERYPDCAVVFVGPCAAKKNEAKRPENEGAIDVVLTFTELDQWMAEKAIDLANCTDSQFDTQIKLGDSRLFPLQGGMLRAAEINCVGTEADIIHISGSDEIMELLDDSTDKWPFSIVEPLFCKGGCINGPAFNNTQRKIYDRRSDVILYTQNAPPAVQETPMAEIAFTSVFKDDKPELAALTESQILKVLEKTGKVDANLQLNCGACGYRTCRENAEAVVRGMAEIEMCMPYMRRQAQQRSDRIIETSPNGIVMLDNELNIIKMNQAFQTMFMCNNGILGRRISYLLKAEGFEKIRAGTHELYESIQFKYGVKYHEIVYALRDEDQYVGIYSNISKLKYDAKQLDVVKIQTLHHAEEFLNDQIRFSQEMAHYLGKSTAQSEELVKQLRDLYGEEE